MKKNNRKTINTITIYSLLSAKLFKLITLITNLYNKSRLIRLGFRVIYYTYRFIRIIFFILGGGFAITLTSVQDLSLSLELMIQMKDLFLTGIVNTLMKFHSNPTFADVKYFNFPKIPTIEAHNIETNNSFNFWEDDKIEDDKPFYKNKWFYIGAAALIVIVAGTWYFYGDDISHYFNNKLDKGKGPDGGSIHTGDTRKWTDGTPTPPHTPNIELNNASSSASRIRFSPQHGLLSDVDRDFLNKVLPKKEDILPLDSSVNRPISPESPVAVADATTPSPMPKSNKHLSSWPGDSSSSAGSPTPKASTIELPVIKNEWDNENSTSVATPDEMSAMIDKANQQREAALKAREATIKSKPSLAERLSKFGKR